MQHSGQHIDHETTGVIICGGGPTGAMLSALLGQMNVPNVVLERETKIATDPRGIALDEDGIRCIQSIGMYPRVFSEIAHCQDMLFIAGSGSNLNKTPFLKQSLSTSNGTTGHVKFVFHKQPELERAIRDAIAQNPSAELRSGCTVQSIDETADQVFVNYIDPDGRSKKLAARFLIGADGKTGYVRKKYLEPKGIRLERCEGTNYDETWIALNWHITLPTPESHPDFPLWKLGYTPEQVYDTFFPKSFRFLCNPSRPSVCGRFGLPSDRLWRFEFVVQKGEDPQQMASIEETNNIISPYITHPGQWYGLDQPVRFPQDCTKTLRSRPYSFLARSCNKWALGRTVIVGDAAHVFPPFGGQGIVSGFRDAVSLAWRLRHLVEYPQSNHEMLLRGWYTERKQQLEQSLAATIRNGDFVTNRGILQSLLRDWGLWALQLVPTIRQRIQEGPIPSPRYSYEAGLPFRPDLGGGILLPQVYARRINGGDNKVSFTDDLIFSKAHHGLLQLLVLIDDGEQIGSALSGLRGAGTASQGLVKEGEATCLVQSLENPSDPLRRPIPCTVARLASADEFVASSLCDGRPPPMHYDPLRIKKDLRVDAHYVVLRRDRYVYAACTSREELFEALQSIPRGLGLEEQVEELAFVRSSL